MECFIIESAGKNMSQYFELKEKTEHGTERDPVWYVEFDMKKTGPRTCPFYVDRHWHPECEILYVEKGTLELEHNLNTILLHEGDIVLIDPEDLHEITGCSDDTIHHAILFDPKMLSTNNKDAFQLDIIDPFLSHELGFTTIISPDLLAYSLISELVEELIRIMKKHDKYWIYEAKVLLFRLMLASYEMKLFVKKNVDLSEEQRLGIDRYKMIQTYIEEHYRQEIHLEELAELIDCSENYVGRLFKRISHDSPIHYLIQFRIEKACELLKNTTMPVLDIALAVGFTNVSYFIRQFKEFKHTTPLKYRKSF